MTELEQIERAIAVLEAQRATLGDEVVDTALAPLRKKLEALEHPGGPAFEERRLATVLFADLSGFGALSDAQDAEDVQDLLRQLWSQLDQVILNHGGHIDKHIGDAVMAVWGLERQRESDPEQAVLAALVMQAELATFRDEQKVSLAMRVGLNTGLVSVAHLASTGERNVIGDTVNLASRMEQSAPVNGVLIHQSTYDRVRGLVDVRAQPLLKVKGKSQPVQTYLVLGKKARAFDMKTRGLAGLFTRTIGRDSELNLLQDYYQRALSGVGTQWVTISGDAGVGKSRLLIEFVNWLELRPEEVFIFKGRAWPQTEHRPYYLLRDLLSFRFRIRDSDSLSVTKEKLTLGLCEVLESPLGEEAAAFIGQLVGFDFRESRWIIHIAEDTRQIRGRAMVLLRGYLARLCFATPAVFLLEDLHWADEESLTLLNEIFSEPQPWKLNVIGLTRPYFWDRELGWGQQVTDGHVRYHYRLDLKSLTNTLSYELVEELLQKTGTPPDWVVELLVERGDGNPYFMEELVHLLIERGVIKVDVDTWLVDPQQPESLSVPVNVQGVLQDRLEQLEHDERTTIQQAAVLGRTFWDGAVEYIGGESVPEDRWIQLQLRDLVFKQPVSQLVGETEYQFKHVLLRDFVYEYTLKKNRRIYHKRAADWLVKSSVERADEWAAVIATHYEDAKEDTEAAKWYLRAGQKAQATYALDTAFGYYQKAGEYLPVGADEEQALLYDGLSEVLRWQARFAEAADAYREMLKVGNAVVQARAYNGLSQVQHYMGDFHDALDSAKKAEQIALNAGPSAQVELARAFFRKGVEFFSLGDPGEALELGDRALELSTKLDDKHVMARSMSLLGAAHSTFGHHDQATHFTEKSLALYRTLGDRIWVGGMLNNLGVAAASRGDYSVAADAYQDALEIAREIGHREWEMTYMSNLGIARIGLGKHQDAEADLRQALHLAETAGWGGRSDTFSALAEACLGLQKLDDALNAARTAIALAKETEQQGYIGQAWRVLGMVAAQLSAPVSLYNQSYDPTACFNESLQTFTEIGMEGERARTIRAWARYEIDQGDKTRGETMWQEAREIFTQLDMGLELEKMTEQMPTTDHHDNGVS